jgi:hypothetical protein
VDADKRVCGRHPDSRYVGLVVEVFASVSGHLLSSAPGITRTAARTLMRLLDDADVAHGGVLRHQQVERGYEQSSDLVVTYVWAGYVDSKPLSLKAALVREGDFCVKNGTICLSHYEYRACCEVASVPLGILQRARMRTETSIEISAGVLMSAGKVLR